MAAAWESAPLVDEPKGKAAWESAPVVDEAPVKRKRLTGSSAIPGMPNMMDAEQTGVGVPSDKPGWEGPRDDSTWAKRADAILQQLGMRGMEGAANAIGSGVDFMGELGGSLMVGPLGVVGAGARGMSAAVRSGARVGANQAGARVAVGEQAAARENALRAPIDEGIKAAHDAGYVLTPEQAGGGVTSRTVETLANKAKLERQASVKNQEITNSKARKDLGIPDDEPITRETGKQIRAQEGKAYEAVKNVGEMQNSPEYFAALDKIVEAHNTSAKSFPHRSENPFKKVIDGLRQDKMDAASAIEEVKLLRADADKAFATRDSGLGRSYRAAAQALDDSINANLKQKAVADPTLLPAYENYLAARQRIAKTYTLDKALNETTGNVDALVYARELKKGAPLSGEAAEIAAFAQQFKNVAQMPERIRGGTGAGFGDLLLGSGVGGVAVHGAGLMTGGAALAATVAARPAARAALLSKPVQARLTRPNAPAQASPTQARIAQILEAIAGREEPVFAASQVGEPTAGQLFAVQNIPTVDVMRQAVALVGEKEFMRRAAKRIAAHTGDLPHGESTLIEAEARSIMAAERMKKGLPEPLTTSEVGMDEFNAVLEELRKKKPPKE